MDPDPLSWLALLLAAGLTALVAAAEVSVANLNRRDLRRRSEDGDRRAARLELLLADSQLLLSSLMMTRTFALLLAGFAVDRLWPPAGGVIRTVGLFLLVWLLLVVLQVLTRSIFLARNEAFALLISGPLLLLMRLQQPFLSIFNLLSRRVGTDESIPLEENVLLSEDGLRLLINVRQEEDEIEDNERQMIASILEMEETLAREAMIPRIDIVALDVETEIHAALDVIIQAGHSRIPVYEGNIDHIIGLLYAKDLLPCFMERQFDRPIRDLLRPPYFVPATKRLNELFSEMQLERTHISVVVDEYGGTAGLITIEDILEEIVGDIQDEYDPDEDEYVQTLSDGVHILSARLDVDTLAAFLAIELPDDHADTLGGFLYGLLGRVPDQGESVQYGGWLFSVVKLDGRRIEQVRVELIERPQETGEESEDFGSRAASMARSLPKFLSL